LFKKIKKGEFEFHKAYWEHISEDAKDLISKMLTLDVNKRITIDEALNHSWVGHYLL
jgi:serine/threonine protein kinase